jgi:hypothetical protein
MDAVMEKTELLETLEDSHQELVEMLEDLPEATLLEKGVMGKWSIKDILAHLTYWEGQLVTLLFQAKSGMPKPSTAHFSPESVDTINERWHQQGQERSLDMVWSDFVGVRKQTIRRVSAFSDQDLQDPKRFPWLADKPLWMWVMSDSVEHEEEHGDVIRDWLDQHENKTNGSRP